MGGAACVFVLGRRLLAARRRDPIFRHSSRVYGWFSSSHSSNVFMMLCIWKI